MAQRHITAMGDFRGGMNVDTAPELLLPTELSDAVNVVLSERGALTKRAGSVPLNDVPYDGPVTQIFEWPRANGDKVLMAVVGGALCEVDENGDLTVVDDTLSLDRTGHFFFQDKLYYVTGTDYKVYDGEEAKTVEPKPPDPPEDDDDASDDDGGDDDSDGTDDDNDLTPIKRCRFLLRHPKSFRFFAAGDPDNTSAVYYSEPNEPDYWKETSVLVPSTDDGPVTGLATFGDAVLVFFRNSVWVWRGIDPELDVVWEKLAAPAGTLSPASVSLTPQTLTWLGDGGLFSMAPPALGLTGEVDLDGHAFMNLSENRVSKRLVDILQPEQVCAVYDGRNRRYMLSYTKNEEGSNDTILVFDWALGAFTFWEGLGVYSWCYRHSGELLAGLDGFIARLSVGGTDVDVATGGQKPIGMRVVTPIYNPAAYQPKRFVSGGSGFRYVEGLELTVDVVVDGKVVDTVSLQDLIEGIPEAGEDWRNLVVVRWPLKENGMALQYRFRHEQANMPVTLYSWAFEWNPVWPKGTQL